MLCSWAAGHFQWTLDGQCNIATCTCSSKLTSLSTWHAQELKWAAHTQHKQAKACLLIVRLQARQEVIAGRPYHGHQRLACSSLWGAWQGKGVQPSLIRQLAYDTAIIPEGPQHALPGRVQPMAMPSWMRSRDGHAGHACIKPCCAELLWH